jgi:hypothetical protein
MEISLAGFLNNFGDMARLLILIRVLLGSNLPVKM